MNVKESILLKAKEEFLQKGIRNMSVQQLTEQLGISTKTFYKYFKNKEVLLEEVITLHYHLQFEIIKDYSKQQNPVQVLLYVWMKAFYIENEVNNKFHRDVHYYYPDLEMRVETKVGKDFWSEFQNLIIKGMDEGFFLKSILPDVIMESIAILYGSAVRSDQFAKFSISPDHSFLNTVATIIRGICTPKGLIKYDEYFAQNFQKTVS